MTDLPITSQTFRECMSEVVSAVHLVTTDGPKGCAGLTASAMTSVSDQPPTVLVCIHKTARSAPFFLANQNFCVNTLCAEDQYLAELFASHTIAPATDRFLKGDWHRLKNHAPVLRSALAVFECTLMHHWEVATHYVLVGEIIGLQKGNQQYALAYRRRSFERV
jgi:flavin reductase